MTAARVTFNGKCDGVAWQKQLRDQLDEPAPPGVSLSLKSSRVKPVSRKIAESIILRYEWLGTLPPYVSRFYGLFFGPYCAGVCCVATNGGGGVNAHQEWGIGRRQFAYLARGACVSWSPPGANSRLVSWTCRLLRRDEPQAKLVVAYSDTDAGEIGTIYQACGWVCVGRASSGTRQWVAPSGRVMDQKLPYDLARKNGGTRAQWSRRLRSEGWGEQEANRKYRYVQILDKTDARLIALVESKRTPYPKRALEAGDDRDHRHSGAAAATQGL